MSIALHQDIGPTKVYLRHRPKFSYSGLCIIMSNPSRHDKKELLDGTGGWYFTEKCLQPELNKYQCDIRLIDDKSPLLTGTKVILLLGARAHSLYTNASTSLDENRGSPIIVNGIPCISSFAPQDAVDPKDYESRLNAEAVAGETEYESEEGKAGDIYKEKGRGSTAWANYRFWLKADTKKAIRILENNGQLPSHGLRPNYIIQPSSQQVIDVLTKTKGQDLYFDMETDFYSIDMRCFAFSFSNKPEDIYVVPTLDVNYSPSYHNLPDIIRALSVALRDNVAVAHNGAVFDFLVLAYKYRIPIGTRVYDTLVANHRIFPTIEKSLGHCVSYWTYEPYHKNEGMHGYYNQEQANALYLYCGKDVFTMYLVKKAQQEYAQSDAGLQASIQQGMDAIRPYLITTLLGMHFNEKKRQAWIKENDRLMTQYLRIMRILCGPNVEPLISNQKCTKYFNETMGYPIVKRTKKNASSLAEDALYKLRLKINTPVIDVLIRYRQVQKQTGTLSFKVWIESDSMKTLKQTSLL